MGSSRPISLWDRGFSSPRPRVGFAALAGCIGSESGRVLWQQNFGENLISGSLFGIAKAIGCRVNHVIWGD